VASDLRIGVAEGAEENNNAYALWKVRGVAVDSSGRIAIANSGTLEVKLFSPDGEFLWSTGDRGTGPGEFLSFRGIESCGDSFVVSDLQARRLSELNGRGELVRTWRWERLRRGSTPFRVACDRSGSTLAFLDRQSGVAADVGPYTVTAVVAGAPMGERAPDILVEVAGIDRYRYQRTDGPAEFGKSTFIAASPGLVHVVVGDAAEVKSYDLDGRLVRVARWPYSARPLTPQVLDATLADAESVLPMSRRAEFRAIWEDMTHPELLPAIDGLVASSNGDLWLRRYRTAAEGDNPDVWFVVSAEGALRGSVLVPVDFEVLRVLDDAVIGLVRDQVGVEYVERRRLDKRDSGAYSR
jgi:hypothetical protein